MARGVGGKSPANIAQHLAGINFPCQKTDVIAHARHNGAEDEVLEMLRDMPEGQYHTMADVMQRYGEARHAEHGTDDGHGSRDGSHAQHAQAERRGNARSHSSAERMDGDREDEEKEHAHAGHQRQHNR